MTYKKLDTGKGFIGVKVDMSKLRKFNGDIDISFSVYGGKLYFKSWNINIPQPAWFGHPEYDELTGIKKRPDHLENSVKMYHGDYDDIISAFDVEPVYP